MKRKVYAALLCVILLVTACAQGQPDIYEPLQYPEPDNGDYPPVEPYVQQEPKPVQEEPEPEVEGIEPEQPQTYDADEPPEPIPTPEEIYELLNSIPYAGMQGLRRLDWLEEYSIFVNSEAAIEMANFISYVNGWWGPPLSSFNSPEEANHDFLFDASFFRTNWLYLGGHPELNVLVPYLNPGTDRLRLHSHVEETAKMLFGQELTIRPSLNDSPGMFRTYEWLGTYAYWLAAFGIPATFIPIILSYEYIDGGYEVACVFITQFDGGYYERGSNARIAEDKDELRDWLRTTTDIHTITLKRNADGGFYYWAHILPED